MNSRRIIAALAAITCVATLAACGDESASPNTSDGTSGDAVEDGGSGDSTAQDVTSIDYWYWQDDTTDPTMDLLAANFEATTGIKVNIMDNVPNAQFYDKLVNAIGAGNGPDATHVNTQMMGQLMDAEVLVPLDDMIAEWDGADNVISTMWNYVKSPDGDVTYALPNKLLMFYVFYRADIFAAEGVEFPTTQEEFVAAAEALTDPAKDQYGFDIRGGTNGQDQWAAFLVAGGAQFLDENGDVILDNEAAKKANDLYISTFPFTPPGSVNNAGSQVVANLESGTAAMIIKHMGDDKILRESLGDKLGTALIPSATGDPSQTTYLGTMNANAILADSDKQEAAFQWISFLASDEAQIAIARSTNGYVPVTVGASQDPDIAADPGITISLEAARYGTTSWPTLPGTTAAATSTWQPLFQGALLGENSNDAVVEGVAESLRKGR